MKRSFLSLMLVLLSTDCFGYYQAEKGRWLSRDPLGEAGFNVAQNGQIVDKLRAVESEEVRVRSELNSANRQSNEGVSNSIARLIFYRLQLNALQNIRADLRSHLSVDLAGAYATANPYHFVYNQPIGYIDSLGLDIWIEDASEGEPLGHTSISIGDPQGNYESYSFGVLDNPFSIENGLQGGVYRDHYDGGKIQADSYLKTSPEIDQIIQRHFREMEREYEKGKRSPYRIGNDNCRTWTREQYEALLPFLMSVRGGAEQVKPPVVKAARQSPNIRDYEESTGFGVSSSTQSSRRGVQSSSRASSSGGSTNSSSPVLKR